MRARFSARALMMRAMRRHHRAELSGNAIG